MAPSSPYVDMLLVVQKINNDKDNTYMVMIEIGLEYFSSFLFPKIPTSRLNAVCIILTCNYHIRLFCEMQKKES